MTFYKSFLVHHFLILCTIYIKFFYFALLKRRATEKIIKADKKTQNTPTPLHLYQVAPQNLQCARTENSGIKKSVFLPKQKHA